MNKKTIVYIDGFNFYYACLKSTEFRWLNLETFLSNLLPKENICKIKLFTAKVKNRDLEDKQAERQQTYFRALSSLSKVEIIYGHFLTHNVLKPLAVNPQRRGRLKIVDKNGRLYEETTPIQIIKTEEKGSDVNLASHLLRDLYKKNFERAIVISNDNDLALPMKFVKEEEKFIGFVNPNSTKNNAHKFKQFGITCIKNKISNQVLKNSQFSNIILDKKGKKVYKPKGW